MPVTLAAEVARGPFLLAFVLALALVPLCHRIGTRTGGIAIALTLVAGAVALDLTEGFAIVLACGAAMAAAGAADDIASFAPPARVLLQIAVASALVFFGYRLNWTSRLTIDEVATLLSIVLVMSAFKLLDSVETVCAVTALVVGGVLLATATPGAAPAVDRLEYIALLVGATAGFLVYNACPATVSMGSSGSWLIGVTLAAVLLGRTDGGSANWTPLLVLVVPLVVMAARRGRRWVTIEPRVVEMLLDVVLVAAAYYAAHRLQLRVKGLRFVDSFNALYPSLPLVVSIQLLLLFASGWYRGTRSGPLAGGIVRSAVGVLAAVVAAELAVVHGARLMRPGTYARAVFAYDAALLGAALLASRGLVGAAGRRARQSRVVVTAASPN